MAILAVGPIEADIDTPAPVPLLLAIVVKRELAGPAVVSLPGRIGALKDEVGSALIAHDKDDVALKFFAFGGELAEIHTARPVGRNHQCCAWFPLAFAQPFRANRRIRLNGASVRAKVEHVASARAGVIAHSVNIDCESRCGIGADMEGNLFAGAQAGA